MSNEEHMALVLSDALGTDEDLRERVKLIVMRWVAQRQIDPAALRDVASMAVDGIGSGLGQRGQVAAGALGEAVRGLDEALSRSVYALQMAAEETWDDGRQFAANDLRASLDELRELEGNFVQALRAAADKSQGWLRQELTTLGAHLADNGTDTGRRVGEVSEVLASRLKGAAVGAGGAALADAALIRARFTAVASGVLRGLADAIEAKHQN